MKKPVLKPQFVFVLLLICGGFSQFLHAPGQEKHSTFEATVPRMWDDNAIATLELPLADPVGSPKHISSDYYYRIPVRSIYKSYPVYAPGYEPPEKIQGATEGWLLPLGSKGGTKLLAKYVTSSKEFLSVRYRRFSVVSSSYGELSPQYRCSRMTTAPPTA